MVMSWTTFSINLTYMSSAMPDSAMIILSASGTTPVASSYLYVDNLAFTGSVTGIKNIENNQLAILTYPNPTTEQLTVELTTKKVSAIHMQLIDITGKLIHENNETDVLGSYKQTINTSQLSKGIYFLKISAQDTLQVKKVIIK
jgi:hypothetical protein